LVGIVNGIARPPPMTPHSDRRNIAKHGDEDDDQLPALSLPMFQACNLRNLIFNFRRPGSFKIETKNMSLIFGVTVWEEKVCCGVFM
jgi:hypothetical protein